MRLFKTCFHPLCWLLCLLLNMPLSYGKTFLASDIQSIKIKVLRAHISFQHKNTKHLQIEWDQSVKLINGVLEITDSSYHSKKAWNKIFSQKELSLKIIGPNKPISLFAADVKLNFLKWKQAVFISAHKSQIQGQKTAGLWEVFSKHSNMNLSHHNGSIYFKGFSLKAKLRHILKTKSHFYFNDGSLKFTKSSGDLFFTTDRAKLNLRHFKGNLAGTTQSGSINVSMKPDTQVDVYSKEGEMRFYFQNQGAHLVAYAEKGHIYAPSYMNKKYSGKSLQVTGKLKGEGRGKVSLKTETGKIYVY